MNKYENKREIIIPIILIISGIFLSSCILVIIFWSNIVQLVSGDKMQERQAVFLANGQVYFGQIKKDNSNYLVLDNIYYLKTQDQLDTSNPDKKVSIIKLGDELHGPEDRMYINKDQVLFYETMKPNSKINEAINRFVAAKK